MADEHVDSTLELRQADFAAHVALAQDGERVLIVIVLAASAGAAAGPSARRPAGEEAARATPRITKASAIITAGISSGSSGQPPDGCIIVGPVPLSSPSADRVANARSSQPAAKEVLLDGDLGEVPVATRPA